MHNLTPAAVLAAALNFPSATAAEAGPAMGFDNLKLGMTRSEAKAAEPRARPGDCAGENCLEYFDRSYRNAAVAVSASFDDGGRVDVIIASMVVSRGAGACRDLHDDLTARFTSLYGKALALRDDITLWRWPEASLGLANICDGSGDGVLLIMVESPSRDENGEQGQK